MRRFPPPWTVEETDACFIGRDENGQALAYVYFEDEPPAVVPSTGPANDGAGPRRSGTKRGLAAAYLIWIKKR